MGKPITVSAQVEIRAPPAEVRSVFLDFARYKDWQQGWDIQSIDAGNRQPSELKSGDRLKVSMHGMVFRPNVAENSTDRFTWEGSLYGILVGKHQFHFSPSQENPGGTTFIQTEDFTGLLTVLYRPWSKKEQPMENWDEFNAALKEEAEKLPSRA
ncbi:hypothetical protein B0T10DRAFT_568092 [Thelonectria olida]|uniref:SRPBCC domain-containing protein n=1 Tax=Thelonectria olida TaxID=1576542 RepID=A0A9P8VT28_9HYPO|nr:hypothetical protein B0T10DRAFT_568092 [Thelonectria olida]